MLISRPSVVDNVITDLLVELANDAVTPVVACKPLIAEARPDKSLVSVTLTETELPFKVMLTVPVEAIFPSVALLVAVAVMPMLVDAALMAAAIALASAPAA